MFRVRRWLVLFWFLSIAARLAGQVSLVPECPIASGGNAVAIIVDAEDLAGQIPDAVKDLQLYIRRMSGAQVRLGSAAQPGLAALHLCTSGGTQDFPGREELQQLNAEGFLIRVSAGQAWLCGRTPLAVQHAIYWLLEQWGCRWLFPGDAGEVVPARNSLVVTAGMATRQEPAMLMRQLWYNWGNFLTDQIREGRRAWMRRNRLDYSLSGTIGHAYQRFLPRDDDALFAAHPEYFPMQNGKRVRNGQICTCNPGVRERAVRYALDYFRQNPGASIVSMSPYDGGGPWQCPDCEEVRSFSDAALGLANYVADQLQRQPETRGKLVGLYAYYDTAPLPSFKAHDNVMVFVATRFARSPWPRVASGWRSMTRHLGIRDYASVLVWSWTGPTWGLDKLQENARLWLGLGVEGVSIESGNDWGGWGLYHYVLGRLLWDPRAGIPEIVDDYLKAGFGAAAPVMRRYFERWKAGFSSSSLEAARMDLSQALRLESEAQAQSKMELLCLYLHHLRLLSDYKAALGRENRVQALRKLIAFSWRLAPTHMAYTIPLIDAYLWRDARKLLGVTREEFDSWKPAGSLSREEIRLILKREFGL